MNYFQFYYTLEIFTDFSLTDFYNGGRGGGVTLDICYVYRIELIY